MYIGKGVIGATYTRGQGTILVPEATVIKQRALHQVQDTSLWVAAGEGVSQKPPKQSLSPGYPEKLEDKSLLMRTPLALVSAHGKIRQQCGLPDTLAAVLGCPCQINLQSSETKFCGFWATECLIICYSHSRKLIPPPDWAPITDKETGEWKCRSHSGIKLVYSLHFLGTIFKNYKGKTSPATPAWVTSVSVLTTDIDECVLFNGVWVFTVFDYEL